MSRRGLRAFASQAFSVERDAYASFLELACAEARAAYGYLYCVDRATGELMLTAVSAAAEPLLDEQGPRRVAAAGAGPWAECLRTRRAVAYRGYPPAAPSPLPGLDVALQSHVSLPVHAGGEALGVLGLVGLTAEIDDALTERLAGWLGGAWQLLEERLAARRARVRQRAPDVAVEQGLEEMIRAIASAMEMREEHSARHQQNVAHLCDCIAREIGMRDFERRGLAIGASVHDIGKIGVPAALLSKVEEVSVGEAGVLRSHAEAGAALFREVRLPWPVFDMIAQHHERIDGSGYPARLQRNDICEGARIIAIADTYDAMASDRPYRRARGTASAMETLRQGRGSLYDGYLVNAFLRCARADPGFGGRYRSA